MLRVCIDCLIAKSPEEFYYNPSRTDHLQTRCIPCYIEYQKTYYQANREKRQQGALRRYYFLKATDPAKISRPKKPTKPKEVVTLEPRICIVCLQSFTRRPREAPTNFLQRKTCTPTCYRLLKQKPRLPRHLCANALCQKSFKEGHPTAPYCSSRCHRRAIAQHIIMLGQFECRLCHVTQLLSNFESSKKHLTGHETRCKTCRNKQHEDFLAEHPDYDRLHKRISKKTPEERKAYRRQQYLKNKAKHAAGDRRWRQTHPELVARQRQIKHARKMGAPVVEKVSRLVIYLRDKWICQICFKKVTRREASLDHVIPLSKGGEHSARNLVLAHKSCNSSKGNRVVTQQMRLFG